MKTIIVSRHPAAVEFIRREAPEFADALVLAQATADDVRGATVAGNLPLHLAALAAEVWAVEFEGGPPRGAEYGVAEMDAAGARLTRYVVASESQVSALDWILHSDGYAGDGVTAIRLAKERAARNV